MSRALGIELAVMLLGCGAPVAGAPQRIVSPSSRTDQLLLSLAPRQRITALTDLATRPDLSPLWREAAGIAQVRGSAEEVLLLQPDLVLANTYRPRQTVKLLRQFGIPILTLPPAKNFADVRQQIRGVAAAVGEPLRGVAMLAALERELAQLATTASRSGAF